MSWDAIREDKNGSLRGFSSRDLSLNLTGNQGDNALKQLKRLTSPLSNIGKGLQSLGANLDPRKMAVKVKLSYFNKINQMSKDSNHLQTPVLPARSMETPTAEIKRLEEKWDNAKCRSKLIAL